MTVPRYLVIVTIAYLAAFTALLSWAGEFEVGVWATLRELWPVFVGALALGPFVTLAIIARFGDATGSVYFLPTAIHCFLLVCLLVAILFDYYSAQP